MAECSKLQRGPATRLVYRAVGGTCGLARISAENIDKSTFLRSKANIVAEKIQLAIRIFRLPSGPQPKGQATGHPRQSNPQAADSLLVN